jgi:hypothetical protein
VHNTPYIMCIIKYSINRTIEDRQDRRGYDGVFVAADDASFESLDLAGGHQGKGDLCEGPAGTSNLSVALHGSYYLSHAAQQHRTQSTR